jgi:hypothetical protein
MRPHGLAVKPGMFEYSFSQVVVTTDLDPNPQAPRKSKTKMSNLHLVCSRHSGLPTPGARSNTRRRENIDQVSPQLVHQLRMICTKLSISSDNDVKVVQKTLEKLQS